MQGVVNVTQPINFIDNVSSFTIMGDPGCDGLGVEIMTTFAKALSTGTSDFKIILGDLVPVGIEQFYEHISELINEVSLSPVYALCGNHDTEYYDKYFGLRNYCLISDDLLILMLDDSRRRFETETLRFLSETLEKYHRRNIIVTFHIPPLNHITPNGISQDEWVKLRTIMDPYKSQIKYLISGHIHSYFRDTIDGYPLIVSGGAGARLEFFGQLPDQNNSFHHVLQFYFDASSELQYHYLSLADVSYDREEKKQTINKHLHDSFMSESAAHMRYQLFADDAHDKGYPGLEKLFRVLAKSAFYHARSYFSVLNQLIDINSNLILSKHFEDQDQNRLASEYLHQAIVEHSPLASYAFMQASKARNTYLELLQEAITVYKQGRDMESYTYVVCTSCGNTGVLSGKVDYCPICGAPLDKIITM